MLIMFCFRCRFARLLFGRLQLQHKSVAFLNGLHNLLGAQFEQNKISKTRTCYTTSAWGALAAVFFAIVSLKCIRAG